MASEKKGVREFLKEHEGFRELLLKSCAFVVILALMEIATEPLARHGLSKDLKPISFLQIGESILFVMLLFLIYNRKRLIGIKAYGFCLRDAVFVLLSYGMLALNYEVRAMAMADFPYWYVHRYLLMLIIGCVLFMMTVFLALGVYGKRMAIETYFCYRGQMKYLIGALAGYFSLFSFVQGLWPVFSGVVSRLVAWLLGLTYDDVSYMVLEGGIPLVSASAFTARIGAPCSGIESFLLFVSLFIILVVVDYPRADLKRALMVFVPGVVGVFLLNVLRIYLLFMAGIHISPEFAVGFFHSNAGWILFTLYFLGFVHYVYPWVLNGKIENPSTSEK